MTSNIHDILKQRGNTYNLNGSYSDFAVTCQAMKDAIHLHHGWSKTPAAAQESIDMIIHKLVRIVNGNPYYKDNWDDICGYATLITRELPDAKQDV